jgi:hypothetical protein
MKRRRRLNRRFFSASLRRTLTDAEYSAQIPPVPANVEPDELYAPYAVTGSGSRDWTAEQWDFYRWMYCRLVEEVDQQIGRIFTALRRSGLDKNTVIVFTADHGEMAQSHGLVFKAQLFDEATHTPLIIAGAGVRRGVVDRLNLTCGIDVAPTICDLAGVPVPANLEGRSLRPLLTGEAQRLDRDHIRIESSIGDQLFDGTYQYNLFRKDNRKETLFNVSSDPGELRNLADSAAYGFVKQKLRNQLLEELQTTVCNPIDLNYGWGTFKTRKNDARTAADPVVVRFKGKYYLFTTMDTGGYRVSNDLMHWHTVYFNPEIRPAALYDGSYVAPAVAADDRYVYFVNFTRDRTVKTVDVIRSADPASGQWERCGKVRRMADPCLFIDNGRFFFYYGLGDTQPTKVFEVDPETFEEIPGSLRVLREKIGAVDTCRAGYQFGRREIYDEVQAPALQGKYQREPCPEGAWIVKHNDRYYLQYATPGTICNWYCDVVLESNRPDSGFVEQPYNPVSLKVGGFIGGAGHSTVFEDNYGNWWHATSMWVGNRDEFERRIGLFPVSFDDRGRMRVHTVLGDYPMQVPQRRFTPADVPAIGWMLQSFNKPCSASSALPDHVPDKAADENVRTWWSAATGNAGEYLTMNLGKRVRLNALQVNFAEQDINPADPPESDYHAYRLYVSDNGVDWTLLIDKSTNRTALPHDYIELPAPIETSYVKIENIHTPKSGKFALLDLRLFGSGHSPLPAAVKSLTAQRDPADPRYATLRWNRVPNADGYLVRFGYQPDFLNQCIQVKGNDTTQLLLHILLKDVKYYYRVDTYNDSGITEGKVN